VCLITPAQYGSECARKLVACWTPLHVRSESRIPSAAPVRFIRIKTKACGLAAPNGWTISLPTSARVFPWQIPAYALRPPVAFLDV